MKNHDERDYLIKCNNKNCKFKKRKINMQKMHIRVCINQIEFKSVQILLFLLEFTDALINFIICIPESPPGNNSNN